MSQLPTKVGHILGVEVMCHKYFLSPILGRYCCRVTNPSINDPNVATVFSKAVEVIVHGNEPSNGIIRQGKQDVVSKVCRTWARLGLGFGTSSRD